METLRSGAWLTWARIRGACALLFLAYAATFVFLLSGTGHLDPLGRPIGTDFSMFYAVSRALLDGTIPSSLYSPAVFEKITHPFTHGDRYVWLYPPVAFLPYWPIGLLPYVASLFAWVGLGLAGYLVAITRLLPGRAALVTAAAFPAVFVAAQHGHNGLLVAACVGWALALLPVSQAAAGVLLGIAAVKPHVMILVPVALLAGRRWRALGGMSVAVAVLVTVSAIAFGVDSWRAFLESAPIARAVIEREALPYFKIASVFSFVRQVGGSVGVAYAVQAAAAVTAALAVAWLWASKSPYELKCVALLFGSFGATPYAYDYDLVVLGVGIALFVRLGVREGWLPWEKTALAVAWAAPLCARTLAYYVRLPLVPLIVGSVVALAVRRACFAADEQAATGASTT